LLPDETHTIEVFPLNAELKESCWRWGKPRAEAAINTDPSLSDVVAKQVSSGKWNVYEKSRLSMSKVKSLWAETAMRTEDGTRQTNALFPEAPGIFDHPKSIDLIQRCIKLVADEGDLVMDFFSGSATCMHAAFCESVSGLGLRTLLIQIPESCPEASVAAKKGYLTICEVAEERIRRAGDKIKAEVEEANRQPKLGEEPKMLLDIGFRVFELDESGIAKPEPGKLMLDVVKPDRSELDIVFEMMLKWGLELTLPVEKSDAAGYPIWSVACDELICCMASGLTTQALEAIAEMEPRRVLALDSVLDDTLKLNAVQIFKHAQERCGREIELRTV
jgi:adenine-specific DNA-methyltransferase